MLRWSRLGRRKGVCGSPSFSLPGVSSQSLAQRWNCGVTLPLSTSATHRPRALKRRAPPADLPKGPPAVTADDPIKTSGAAVQEAASALKRESAHTRAAAAVVEQQQAVGGDELKKKERKGKKRPLGQGSTDGVGAAQHAAARGAASAKTPASSRATAGRSQQEAAVVVKKSSGRASSLARRHQRFRDPPPGSVLPKMNEVERHRDGSVTKWLVANKRVGRPEIHPSAKDQVPMPRDLPMVEGLKTLLPAGLSEKGLMMASRAVGLAKALNLPQHYNASLPDRPQKINDLLSVLIHAKEPEMRFKAVEQLRWIRTKMSVTEAQAVLDETVANFGWWAGLKYLERMGQAPHLKLGLRHFNRLVEHCCKEALGSEHAVRVVEAAMGQGLIPTIRTVYLILEAAARDGDYVSAERVLQVAKAYALRADTRSLEKLLEAYAKGGQPDKAGRVLVALARARHWPEERVLRELVEAAAVTGEGSTVLPPWLEGLPSDDATWQQRRDWLCREMVRVMARRANPDGAADVLAELRSRPVSEDRELYVEVMAAMLEQGRKDRALQVVRSLPSELSLDVAGYAELIKACVDRGAADVARELSSEMERVAALAASSSSPSSAPAIKSQALLLRTLGLAGRADEAVARFKACTVLGPRVPASILLLNAALGAVKGRKGTGSRQPEEDAAAAMMGLVHYAGHKGLQPDAASYTQLIQALPWPSALYLGQEAALMLPQPSAYVTAALASVLGKAGQWRAAVQVVERAGLRNLVCYNSALDALALAGEWEKARDLLRRMEAQGVAPDIVSYTSAMSACGQGRQVSVEAAQACLELLRELEQPAAAAAAAAEGRGEERQEEEGEEQAAAGADDAKAASPPRPSPSLHSYTAAIHACGKARLFDQTLLLFRDRLPRAGLRPNLAVYNVTLAACAHSGRMAEAVELLHDMRQRGGGLRPDQLSYGHATNACAKAAGGGVVALRLLMEMREQGLAPSLPTCKNVLHALANTNKEDMEGAEPLRPGTAAMAVLEELLVGGGRGGRWHEEESAGMSQCWALVKRACEVEGREAQLAYRALQRSHRRRQKMMMQQQEAPHSGGHTAATSAALQEQAATTRTANVSGCRS